MFITIGLIIIFVGWMLSRASRRRDRDEFYRNHKGKGQ